MSQPTKPSRRGGGQSLAGTLSYIVLAVGFTGMTYRVTLQDTGSPAEAWNSVFQIGYLAILLLPAVMVPVLILRQLAEMRERRLRAMFPDAILLRSMSASQLRKALKGAVGSDLNPVVGLGSGSLTLMASAQGVTVWAGWG
jgi:hypothetical protein